MDLKRIRGHIPYILALLVITTLFLFQFFNPRMPASDFSNSKFPFAVFLKKSVVEYGDFWPLWYPYGFSGSPYLMKPIIGLDSFLGLSLFFFSNEALAVKMSYVPPFFLAGLFMYIFMLYLGLDKRFAFVSALVYMLNGHVGKLLNWGWLTTLSGYCFIPLIFLFGTKAIREKNWVRNSVITAIIFALVLRVGPDMKVGLWVGLIFGLYLIFNLVTGFKKKKMIKIALISFLIIIIFFGLSAQRILSHASTMKMTSRADTSWEKASGRQLHIKDVWNRLIEPIYSGMPKIQRKGVGDHIGIIAFFLVCFAIYKKWSNKKVLFFLIIALLSIFIASNTFGLYKLLWNLPFFKSMRYMDRSLFLFVFSMSVLAGFGARELFKKIKSSKRNVLYFILIGFILLNLWLFNYTPNQGNLNEWQDPKIAVDNNAILQFLSKQTGKFRIQTWETRGIDWGTDLYNVPLGLEHIYRYDTLWYPPYMNVYLSVAFNNPAKFWGILNLKYVTAMEPINVSGLKFVKKFENCTVCFPNAKQLQKAWGPYLYENELFLPRAYVVDNSVLVVGEEESKTQTIYALMLNDAFNPENAVIIKGEDSINKYNIDELKKFSAIVLTQGSIDQNSGFILMQYVDNGGRLFPNIIEGKNSISDEDIQNMWSSFSGELNPINDENIITHNFGKREVKLDGAYKDGFLVYSEKFSVFPGWNAKADGKGIKILSANAMISAIYLDDNFNNIIFKYQPKSYIIGLIITITSILLLIIYFVYNKFKG